MTTLDLHSLALGVLGTSLSTDYVRTLQGPEVFPFLSRRDVIDPFKTYLEQLILECAQLTTPAGGALRRDTQISAKIFLISFFMVAKPALAFSPRILNPHENAVKLAAAQFVGQFETITAGLSQPGATLAETVTPDAAGNFLQAAREFCTVFISWEAVDKEVMLETIEARLIARLNQALP
jgi:hypothetical protein